MTRFAQQIVKQYLRSLHDAGVTHADSGFVDIAVGFADEVLSNEISPPQSHVESSVAEQRASSFTSGVSNESSKGPAAAVASTSPPPMTKVKEASKNSPAKGPSVPPQQLSKDTYTSLPPTELADRASSLQILAAEVSNCTTCSELARTRTQTVFGVGNPQARLVFLGEAPGADEDRQGEPFVGAAGQKLNDIITGGMNLSRDDVYILNVLRCRPPGNRNPSEGEAANCRGFLDRQLEIIRPEFICCLGGVAATRLLDSRLTIGRLRGKWHDYRGAKVMATYHPSYLLRNPSARKYVWDDIKMLMGEMGLPIPGESD